MAEASTALNEAKKAINNLKALNAVRLQIGRLDETAVELMNSMETYRDQVNSLQKHLESRTGRSAGGNVDGTYQDIASALLADSQTYMAAFALLAEVVSGKGEGVKALTGNTRESRLQKMKGDVDACRQNLVDLMIAEKLMRADDEAAELKQCSHDGRSFWRASFGKSLDVVGVDGFASKFLKYLESHNPNWARKYDLPQDVFRKIVACVVAGDENAEHITLTNFAIFSNNFIPLNSCFVKMACLCKKKDGSSQGWFVHLSQPAVWETFGWLIRYSSTKVGFTLEIATGTSKPDGVRILLLQDGQLQVENGAVYDNLASLAKVEVPQRFNLRRTNPKKGVLECLDHWKAIYENPPIPSHDAKTDVKIGGLDFYHVNSGGDEGNHHGGGDEEKKEPLASATPSVPSPKQAARSELDLVEDRLDKVGRDLSKIVQLLQELEQ